MNQEHLHGDTRRCIPCDGESPEDALWCIHCGARLPVEGPTQRLIPSGSGTFRSLNGGWGISSRRSVVTACTPMVRGESGMMWADCVVGEVQPDGTLEWKPVKMGIRMPAGDDYAEYNRDTSSTEGSEGSSGE